MSNLDMSDSDEKDSKTSEDMTYIRKSLISHLKEYNSLYDPNDSQGDSMHDETKDFIIIQTYEKIATKLTKLMEDRFDSKLFESQYVFAGMNIFPIYKSLSIVLYLYFHS